MRAKNCAFPAFRRLRRPVLQSSLRLASRKCALESVNCGSLPIHEMCVRTCESPVSHAHAMPPPSKRKPLHAVALIVSVLVLILLSIAAPSLIAGGGAPRAPPAGNTPPQAPHLEADRQATIRAALAGEAANIDPKDTDFTLWHEYAEAIADQPVCPGHPDFKDKPHAKCHIEVVVKFFI